MKIKMNLGVLTITTLLCASAAVAQDQNSQRQSDTRIPRNPKIYIAPIDGFEIYWANARAYYLSPLRGRGW